MLIFATYSDRPLWRVGRVAMLRIANPSTSVRLRDAPPFKIDKLPTVFPRIKYQVNRENYFLYDIVNDNYSELSIIMTVEKLRYWLSFIIASVAVFFFMNQFDLFGKNIENQLVTMSKEINKNTPYQLDQFTILDSTIAYKNTIVYKMTIFNVNFEDSEMDFVKNKLFLTVRNLLCTEESTKKAISKGAIFKYMYSEENGKHLFSFTIDSKDCLEMLKDDSK